MKTTRSVRNRAPMPLLRPALVLATACVVAWAILACLHLTVAGQQAHGQVALAARGVAAGLDAAFAPFVRQTEMLRPEDVASADRVTQTTRMLRLQSLLPPGATTFLLGPHGHLRAASAPFLPQDASVAEASWFGAAIAGPATGMLIQPLARPWLGLDSGFVLTQVVADSAGRPAGLVGAVLPPATLAALARPAWLPAGLSAALQFGATTLPPDQPAEPQANWPTRLMLTALRGLGQPVAWTAKAPLAMLDAGIVVTLSPHAALPPTDIARPILTSGSGVVLAWVLSILAMLQSRSAPGTPFVGGLGADWRIELDAVGRVCRTEGPLPEGCVPRRREALTTALGLQPDGPDAVRINEALRTATAAELHLALAKRTWRVSLVPIETGSVCSGRDITAEVVADCARTDAEAAVVAIRRDQDRLLTSLGHDIRSPMTSIMGICQLLLDGELEEEQRTWLDRMHGSCGALLGMLNGLLEVAGDEVGHGTLLCEPVEVTALIQEVVDLLRPQARDKGLELRMRCDDLLRGQWLLDPGRLRQVVFNLASNAVKFTASGRVEIRASASESDGQSRLRIAVSDTGPGIDPAEREQIFERFKRGRTQEDSAQGGLGLGLALCRDNARLMGGGITLESALGVGSEFTFECPAHRVPAQDRLLPFAGRTALIVADDDPSIRALAGQLGELGLMVETAPDGYLGLALAERLEAQRGAVDLVVLQGALPGMPGEVFVRRLRATQFGRSAVLLWIGNAIEAADVDACVPPPPDPYQIAATARQLLAERPSLEALEPNVSPARGGRVLLVEDDLTSQALLAASLSRRSFAVFTAATGEEAVRLAGRDTFDAILMDLQMPGLDGFETARRIRALPGHAGGVPIVALTALHGARLRQRCTEAGFNTVLEKPVNLERLTACLHGWLGAAAANPANAPEPTDYVADVSMAFLDEMVAVVGLDRARACIAEFVSGATTRCRRLGELLPGWEVGAILRSCEEISGMAETCGALALGELLEEIADAVSRGARDDAEGMIERLDAVIARLPHAMNACLDDLARRWSRDSKAA